MEEPLGKRIRDMDMRKDDAPKRLKKTDGTSSAVLPALPGASSVLADSELPQFEESIKQAQSRRDKSLSKLMSFHADKPTVCTNAFLLASLKEATQLVVIDRLAKDTGEKYVHQTAHEHDLLRAKSEVEGKHKVAEDIAAKAKAESQQRVATRYKEVAAMKKMKTSEEEKLKKDIERTRRDMAIYKRMSGVEVQDVAPGTFRCCAQVHCNELIFLLRPQKDKTTDYETASFTVPSDRVPNVLKEAINVDEKDVPELLLRVLNSLI